MIKLLKAWNSFDFAIFKFYKFFHASRLSFGQNSEKFLSISSIAIIHDFLTLEFISQSFDQNVDITLLVLCSQLNRKMLL